MKSKEIRQKFLDFFEKRNHVVVPSGSLIPEDSSVLFTTAGMQQFKPYYLGEKSPYGQNVCSCQKCFRTSDIEETGDESHLTFLEMLGNFSFGGYFKKEAIGWAFEFITKKMGLEIDYVSIFVGDKEVPKDKESQEIWSALGVSGKRIKEFGKGDNFWGPTGQEGPCGPTTEIYIKNLEVWNLVFNEYYQDKNKILAPLSQKGIDTGLGLERLAMVAQKKDNVFETDLFLPIIKKIEKLTGTTSGNLKEKRIIADHVRGSVFLISEGILPANVERGYILRRLIRRAVRYGKVLKISGNFLIPLAQPVIEIYKENYPQLKQKEEQILTVIQNEEEKFEKTLQQGLKQVDKMIASVLGATGPAAFDIYQTYGFPLEMIEEIAFEKGKKIKNRQEFLDLFKKHQEISRAGAGSKFGGIGRKPAYQSVKFHSATHLLQAALKKVLGESVKQAGSDITPERLRFDFFHSRKMTQEEIKKTEQIVNQKIKENLAVNMQEMTYWQAVEMGALALDKERYPEKVSVYSFGDFSKEICAGPHVEKTGQLGRFKIIKEESAGASIRRIRAILE